MGDASLSEALERINEIHDHMAKGEIYRGYRPVPIALAGAGGLLAAWLQPWVVTSADPKTFVYFWMGAAAICAVLAEPMILVQLMRQCAYERRRTLHVWGQFMPCLVAGALVGLGLSKVQPEAAVLLPGLWAMIFSLGVFATRPYLPRATGWVALFYLVAGTWMLLNPQGLELRAWPLALTFFVGQCCGAVILHLNIERTKFDA